MLAEPRHVSGCEHGSPAARLCSWRAPLPAIGRVLVDAVEHSRAQALDLAQATLHVPSPLSPPLVQHVEEPVAGDGVDLDLAALCSAAAGLVFNECSGCGGWSGLGGTRSFDVGDLLMCERPADGFSWSPPGRTLQADAPWKLVVVHDVLLKSSFPELLPAGSTARLLRVPVWWPTQANRQGDGGALGPARPSSEAESRSTDDEERLLTKRSIEWHRANSWGNTPRSSFLLPPSPSSSSFQRTKKRGNKSAFEDV